MHDDSAPIEDCREFKMGRCSRGDACKFAHVGGPPPSGGFSERRYDEDDDRSDRRDDRADDHRRGYDDDGGYDNGRDDNYGSALAETGDDD